MLTLLFFLLLPFNLFSMEGSYSSKSSNKEWFTAAKNGDIKTLGKLLNDGHPIDTKTTKRGGKYRCATGSTALHLASRWGKTETVQWLVKNGADINATDKHRKTPLRKAAQAGHTKTVACLVDHGADLNAADNKGNTPLLAATKMLHTKTVACLVEHGADSNAANHSGTTPLHWAVWRRHTKIACFLAEHGASPIPVASPTLKDKETTKSDEPSSKQISRKGKVAESAFVKSFEVVQAMALNEVAEHGNIELIQQLLEQRANVNAADYVGHTPLHVAVINRQEELASWLVEYGADRDIQDKMGKTALEYKAIEDVLLPAECHIMEL